MNDASKLNHLYFERQAEAMAACKGKGDTLKDRLLNWIQKEGGVICKDPFTKVRLTEYITPVAALFPELIENLLVVYPYCMNEQGSPDLCKDDGIDWEYHDTKTGKVIHAIGISVEGLEKGAEYAQFLFMHELAHIAAGGNHTVAFHDQLNAMIKKFNAETGSKITNDLYGLPSRHDSMPYNPFAEDIPTIVNKP